MHILRQVFENFFADFLRVYKLLPSRLRRRVWYVFFQIFLLTILEVLCIFSLSGMAISVAAPERLLGFSFIPRLFQLFPALDILRSDTRLLALVISVSVVLLTIAKNALSIFTNVSTARLGETIALFAGESIFKHYLYSPYVTHLSGDSITMFQALGWRTNLSLLIIDMMTVYTYAFICFVLFSIVILVTPNVLFWVIICVLLVAGATYKFIKKDMEAAGIASAEFRKQESRVTMNAINGIREILIYRQQDVFLDKFQTSSTSGAPPRGFLKIAPLVPVSVLESVGFLAIPAIIWIMFKFQDASMVRITAILTMVMLVAWRVLPLLNRTLSKLVGMRGLRHSAMECVAKLELVLSDAVDNLVEPDPNFVLTGDITFQQVSFKYPGADVDCLHELNFSIEYGKCFGIIGQSGAGKSSIAAILSGLVQPSSGEFLVDGRLLTPTERVTYSMQVGYVPQTPYIMPGTLAENVAFSQWGKPWDETRVLRACRMAALDIVETHPLGILLPIGDKGAGLSGGQAQRLSIARALYAEPSLLLLDEATSSLDSAVEAAIMNTIYALPNTITTVIIAHRLSTVERCDKLLWIDGGKIVATGTPNEVLPRYREHLDASAAEMAGRHI